jgi:hypothetical protein
MLLSSWRDTGASMNEPSRPANAGNTGGTKCRPGQPVRRSGRKRERRPHRLIWLTAAVLLLLTQPERTPDWVLTVASLM